MSDCIVKLLPPLQSNWNKCVHLRQGTALSFWHAKNYSEKQKANWIYAHFEQISLWNVNLELHLKILFANWWTCDLILLHALHEFYSFIFARLNGMEFFSLKCARQIEMWTSHTIWNETNITCVDASHDGGLVWVLKADRSFSIKSQADINAMQYCHAQKTYHSLMISLEIPFHIDWNVQNEYAWQQLEKKII